MVDDGTIDLVNGMVVVSSMPYDTAGVEGLIHLPQHKLTKTLHNITKEIHMSLPYMLWLDLETTGLYGRHEQFEQGEREHDIVEVAYIISDPELNILHQRSFIVRHDDVESVTAKMNDYVKTMHMSSGLMEELETSASAMSLSDIEYAIMQDIALCCEGKPVLAGSSIHFDRYFISAQMPDLNDALHYRNFDVSTLKHAYEIITGREFKLDDDGKVEHRAMDDIQYSFDTGVLLMDQLQKKSILRKFWESMP